MGGLKPTNKQLQLTERITTFEIIFKAMISDKFNGGTGTSSSKRRFETKI
jgi:hypothetical protein